jgi:hypothetical protein
LQTTTTELDVGPEQTIYEKTYSGFRVRCYELTAHRVLVYSMYGYIIDARIDSYLADLLSAAQERRPVAMIADPREMRVLSAPLQAAIQQTFWPELARLGVARNAAITPGANLTSSSIGQMIRSAGQVIETSEGTVEIAMLPSLEICLRWCLSRV